MKKTLVLLALISCVEKVKKITYSDFGRTSQIKTDKGRRLLEERANNKGIPYTVRGLVVHPDEKSEIVYSFYDPRIMEITVKDEKTIVKKTHNPLAIAAGFNKLVISDHLEMQSDNKTLLLNSYDAEEKKFQNKDGVVIAAASFELTNDVKKQNNFFWVKAVLSDGNGKVFITNYYKYAVADKDNWQNIIPGGAAFKYPVEALISFKEEKVSKEGALEPIRRLRIDYGAEDQLWNAGKELSRIASEYNATDYEDFNLTEQNERNLRIFRRFPTIIEIIRFFVELE